MESILLTHENNRIAFHAREGIQAVRFDRLVAEDNQSLPADLVLTVTDENNLVLWSHSLNDSAGTGKSINYTVAVWERLEISLLRSGSFTEPDQDVAIRLFYTLNPTAQAT
ncbi:hypothetical protein [Spirosoma flavum]|uniref:Uncharacterized protein n=1 Tax=Spirosoma flavum TaxID=2048557 RepID=A0ABW6AE11_9BACT